MCAAMNKLPELLTTYANGVYADVPEALALYIRAISKGNSVNATNNVAELLMSTTGADVANADPRRWRCLDA